MEMERAMRAELISRAWVAIAHIEELRADVIEKLAVSTSRDKVTETLVAATGSLLAVQEMLLPFEVEHVKRVRDHVLQLMNGDTVKELDRLGAGEPARAPRHR